MAMLRGITANSCHDHDQVEIHKFIAQFLRNFDFKILDPAKPWRITTYWFAMQQDFKMKITFRKNRSITIPEGIIVTEKTQL